MEVNDVSQIVYTGISVYQTVNFFHEGGNLLFKVAERVSRYELEALEQVQMAYLGA